MTRIALLLALSAAALADVVVERTAIVRTTRYDGRVETVPRRERVSIQGANVRIEDLDLAEAWILRVDKGVLWYVDERAGTYAEVPFDLVRQRRLELVEQIQDCAKRVTDKDLSARYQEMLMQLGAFDGAPETTATGEKADIAGRACERVTVKVGRTPVMDALMAPCPGAAEYWTALGRIDAFSPAVAEALAKEARFPMKGKTRMTFLLARVERTEEVSKVEERPCEARLFDLPAGLTKFELPGFESVRGPQEAPQGGIEQDEPK